VGDDDAHVNTGPRVARTACLLLGAALLAGCSVRPTASVPASAFAATATPEPSLGRTVRCEQEVGPVPSGVAGDPCPEAVVAVSVAVAPVRLPIERIVIEPGPFYCDAVWPGVGSPPACYGPVVRPGQFMHAWVSFHGSDQVAAVMLGRDLPTDEASATASPWTATVVTVAVPPARWVMP